MELPPIDSAYLLEILCALLKIPSPSGFTDLAVTYLESALREFDSLELSRNRKGALRASWPGLRGDSPRAVSAHVDTLGAMVQTITPGGRLKISQIGGYPWNFIEGENVTVFTSGGTQVRGTVLLSKVSSHIYEKKVIEETERSHDTLEIRLDARTSIADQTRALGIEVGDAIAFDPRPEVIDGFIRSRHLDDKAGVACILAAARAIHRAKLTPSQTNHLFFNVFEEAGHGAAGGIPADVTELVVVDMAPVGGEQASDEFHATICAKDSHGPYHAGLCQRLRQLAVDYRIPYKVDIYPFYGSDGSSYWEAGGSGTVALIGPGIDASHNYERTHMDALVATSRWLTAYLLN